MCIFIKMSFRDTACKVTIEKKKAKSKAQIHMEDKKGRNETLRKQKLLHPLVSSNYPVDSHTSNTRWSSCSRRNKIPRDDTQIRKSFTSVVSEHPVLALPQHVTLKPKWHWEELHKHGHVVHPAGACCSWCNHLIFFPRCFACQDYTIYFFFYNF